MVVCKFWQQGACRYGDRCRFDHPPSSQGLPSTNRFAALQVPDSSNTRNPTGYQGGAAATPTLPYALDKAAIVTDLSAERPQWILSAYGPGRNAPAQLFGGPVREQSFEEMRLLHYMALASGNPQQAVQEADKLFQASEQQIQTVTSNVDGAIDFIISAEKEHPNRIDICASTSAATSNLFNQGNSTTSFPSTQGQNNPFGAPNQPTASPAFGAPSTAAQTGAFGQPSALGQKPNPFGATPQAFGAPSQLGTAGAFGQPSALGQKPNPFGAPSSGPAPGISNNTTTPFSAFAGAVSSFAQPQQPQAANPFGAPSNPAISSPFSASSQPTRPTPFTQNSTQNSNPFASPNPPPQQNPFGTTPAPFGALSPAPANPFGQPSAASENPFGNAPRTTPNPFAQTPAIPGTATNPFGSTQPPPATTGNGQYGGPSQPLMTAAVGPNGSLQHPSVDSYSTKGAGGRLNMFKGMRVTYEGEEAGFNGRDGSWQKIWFPQGAPAPYKDTEMDDAEYSETIKTAYTHLQQSRSFQGGVMPAIPPKREWCAFDF